MADGKSSSWRVLSCLLTIEAGQCVQLAMSPSFAAVLCFVLVLASADSFNIPNQNDYKVDFSSLFGIPDELYAGFMPVHLQEPNSEGGFFFWLAKKRNKRSSIGDDKLVIWLNGGPGCSSMVGMMWENGPFTLHDKEPSDPLPYTMANHCHTPCDPIRTPGTPMPPYCL